MESIKRILLHLIFVFCIIYTCDVFSAVYKGKSLSNTAVNFEQCSACSDLEVFSDEVTNQEYTQVTEDVPNLGVSEDNHWFRGEIENHSSKDIFLHIPFPNINYLDVYFFEGNALIKQAETGNLRPFSNREVAHQDFIFKIPQSPNKLTVYIRVKNNAQLMLPVNLVEENELDDSLFLKEHLLGIYGGIILVMLLYNLFIYISTRDHNYGWYLIYLLSVGLTQLSLNGLLEKFLFYNSSFWSSYAVHLAGILSGLSVVAFAYFFLNVRKYAKWFEKALILISVGYGITFLLLLLGFPLLSYNIINGIASIGVIVLLIGAISIAKKGFRPAKFFIVAWSFFIASIVVFVLKDIGVLPYNSYTVYAIPFGSAIEVILLSFALADKINILTAEKEEARNRELLALKENEKLILDQNIILEARVKERTQELSEANDELQTVLMNLKNAQTQLVNQEKMASLGQLTAGIAHEINNPINFVSSNINPLRRDINDLLEVIDKYKGIATPAEFEAKKVEIESFLKEIDYNYVLKEIDQLVDGIQDGANRTAEIVKGLKNFSRLDEVESKTANLHQGIDSTLLILLSGLKVKVEVEKNYDPSIGEIECYPGKLNQVFSNILSNGFQAMAVNGEDKPPKMIITTTSHTEHVQIAFKDNGPGIPQSVIDKIFEPFFTTKEVGEGTGLGLSIVFSIIETHNGKIEVKSDPPNGTEFIITIPKSIN